MKAKPRNYKSYQNLRTSFFYLLISFLYIVLFSGCTTTQETNKEISMENPSISSGIMFKDSQGQTIEQLIAELEEHREKTFSTQEVITKSDLGSEPKESDKIDEVKSSLQ